MEKYNEFAGVYTLLLTPFNLDRSIDYRGYEEYVDWQSSFKPQHLFAVCGSSEMSALTPEERVKCAGLAVKNSNGVPVFATANLAESFDDQIEEMKRMEAQGVSGHVFVTKGMCDRHGELYDYLTSLAAHTELPIVLYEYPGLQSFRQIFRCSTIHGSRAQEALSPLRPHAARVSLSRCGMNSSRVISRRQGAPISI